MSRKSQRKQLAILIVLLALLSLSVFTQFSNDTIPVTKSNSADRRPEYTAMATAAERLEVDLLSEEQPAFSGVKRNIFQFGRGADSPEMTNQPVVPAPAPVQSIPQPPPLPQVYYLGFYFEKETGLKLAALSNNGRIFVGRVGQVVGSGRFEVLEIAADHVILKVSGEGGKRIRVPLGKAPASEMTDEPLEQSE